MAYIDNTDTKKEMNDAMRGNSVSNLAPTRIADTVQPVININPKDYRRLNIVKRQTAINATSGTIYTTPADKDFYVTSASLTMIKDVTSTSVSSTISCTIDGISTQLLFIPELSLTVQTLSVSESFPNAIKLDRNTTITVTNSTNVANITSAGCIKGYTVEP
jgi:hypothetical protein